MCKCTQAAYVDNAHIAHSHIYGMLQYMATNKDKFVNVRILETTRARFKVKAARNRRKTYQEIDAASKQV